MLRAVIDRARLLGQLVGEVLAPLGNGATYTVRSLTDADKPGLILVGKR